MSARKNELKIIPKIEKWLEDIDPNDVVLEFLIEELESNPYPRQNNPNLIKAIRGLKKNNPPFFRVRVEKVLVCPRIIGFITP